MSGKQKVNFEEENVDEAVKASYGVNAEIPGPVDVKGSHEGAPADKSGPPMQGSSQKPTYEKDAKPTKSKQTAPGGEAQAGERSGPMMQGSSVKPTKVKMISAVAEAMKDMDSDQIAEILSALNVEGFEKVEESTEKRSIREVSRITAEDINVAEDIDAIFGGQDLSEEFVSRATTVFEAAVVSKVNEILENVAIDVDAEIESEKQEIIESLSQKLDEYLEYVTEEWMTENKLAVEQGIRAEIAENFMTGLRDLFNENYIDIPEEKVDLVDELASKVKELESSMNEEIEKNISLRKELVEMKKESILLSVADGLAESQFVKLQSLAEGVDFENDETYLEKVETLKETYFPSDKTLNESISSLDEEPIEDEESDTIVVDPGMKQYLDAISRTIKK
jgi:hypothetical protein